MTREKLKVKQPVITRENQKNSRTAMCQFKTDI